MILLSSMKRDSSQYAIDGTEMCDKKSRKFQRYFFAYRLFGTWSRETFLKRPKHSNQNTLRYTALRKRNPDGILQKV